MNRPSESFTGRPVDASGRGFDRGVTLMQGGPEPIFGGIAPESASERADRLVQPRVAEHYLRQGERIADAIMAARDFGRHVMDRIRRIDKGRTPAPNIR
jgi:hypothetical protein